MKFIIALMLFLSTASALCDDPTDAFIPRLAKVTEGIYRGGRPNPQGLSELARRGFKTIINIENDDSAMRQEQQQAGRLGLRWISSPMSAGQPPSDRQVNQILSWLQDSRLEPIFIHCKHGQDRTGMIVGLYRVLVQRWSASSAYQEMLRMGFHPEYRALDNYFRARTRALKDFSAGESGASRLR